MAKAQIDLMAVGGSNVASGTFNAVSGENSISVGFKPSKILIYKNNIMQTSGTSPNGMLQTLYDKDLDSSKQFRCYCVSNAWYVNTGSVPASSADTVGIKDLTSTGFVFLITGSYASNFIGTYSYIAIE